MHIGKQLFIVVCLAWAVLMPGLAFALEPGSPAPGFTLKSVQGEEVSLADFQGRLVLLKLGTTWCPACQELSAAIDGIGTFLKERNVVVLDVFVQDSVAMIEKFLGSEPPPMIFRALIDDGQAYRAYNVYTIPRLLVIDAGQTVRFDSGGQIVSAEEIMNLVKKFAVPPKSDGSS